MNFVENTLNYRLITVISHKIELLYELCSKETYIRRQRFLFSNLRKFQNGKIEIIVISKK